MKKRELTITIKTKGSPEIWAEKLPDYYKEYFHELQTNGGNPHIEKITWRQFTRPIKCRLSEIRQFNKKDENVHFIFGYLESLSQSDEGGNLPFWRMPDKDVEIEVGWITVHD